MYCFVSKFPFFILQNKSITLMHQTRDIFTTGVHTKIAHLKRIIAYSTFSLCTPEISLVTAILCSLEHIWIKMPYTIKEISIAYKQSGQIVYPYDAQLKHEVIKSGNSLLHHNHMTQMLKISIDILAISYTKIISISWGESLRQQYNLPQKAKMANIRKDLGGSEPLGGAHQRGVGPDHSPFYPISFGSNANFLLNFA